MNEETLQVVEIIEFRNFKEKLQITKKYDHVAKMEIIWKGIGNSKGDGVMNNVVLIGRLTRDPELRYIPVDNDDVPF